MISLPFSAYPTFSRPVPRSPSFLTLISLRHTNCTATAGCHCETVNGSVKLTGSIRGKVHLESVNGSVGFNTTEKLEQFNCEFDTMAGSVYINGEKQSRKHTTVMSNVAESSLKAETMNGSIRANFAV